MKKLLGVLVVVLCTGPALAGEKYLICQLPGQTEMHLFVDDANQTVREEADHPNSATLYTYDRIKVKINGNNLDLNRLTGELDIYVPIRSQNGWSFSSRKFSGLCVESRLPPRQF